MINCVIFDLDGTLLNTLEDLVDSTNYTLNKFNYPVRTIDEIRNFVGNGVRLLIERAIPNGKDNPKMEDCLVLFKEHYKANMYNKTAPYEGIISLLENLKSQGIKIAVVSNKFDLAVKELCERYFKGLVDVAIGENEQAGIRKKPFPDSVLLALKRLNVDRSRVIFVGDSETDVQTAKNSGIDCIGCTWGFRDKNVLINEGAKYIVSKPADILSIVRK